MPPYPEEPDYYSEPTQAARYGGYHDPAPEPEPPTPWYRRPVVLVAAGAIGVILLGALVFAVVKLATGSPAHSPATTTTPTPSTTAAVTTTTAEPPRHHGGGGGGGGAPTETVTETAPPSTDTGTTTVPPSTVTVSPSTETSTVTQTVTVPPRRPFEPRP